MALLLQLHRLIVLNARLIVVLLFPTWCWWCSQVLCITWVKGCWVLVASHSVTLWQWVTTEGFATTAWMLPSLCQQASIIALWWYWWPMVLQLPKDFWIPSLHYSCQSMPTATCGCNIALWPAESFLSRCQWHALALHQRMPTGTQDKVIFDATAAAVAWVYCFTQCIVGTRLIVLIFPSDATQWPVTDTNPSG